MTVISRNAGDVGRGAPVAVVAVVESHHALDDGYVGIGTVAVEQFPNVLFRGHECVEVHAGAVAYVLVEL